MENKSVHPKPCVLPTTGGVVLRAQRAIPLQE
jgi:hypothetical protein